MPRVPAALRPAARTVYGAAEPLAEKLFRARNGFAAPLPPPELRARTGGRLVGRFVTSGASCAAALQDSLRRVTGKEIYDYEGILDFGCGCGRILLHWDQRRTPRLIGCDVDAECVAWLQTAFRGLEFHKTSFDPPLPFNDAQFDLIYSVSIFSHLAPGDQRIWLRELQRVVRPGGTALITVQGSHALRRFLKAPAFVDQWAGRSLDVEGLVYLPYPEKQPEVDNLRGIESDKREVSYGLTFVSDDYIRHHRAGSGWDVLAHDSGTVDDLQDVVVLRRSV